MDNLVFAAMAPHPPILLPSVGSEADREKVKDTISEMGKLGEKLKEKDPDRIIISSPHPDWGFKVPLFFLAPDFKGEIETLMTGTEEPEVYFEKGKEIFRSDISLSQEKTAVIASGDLSHRLKDEGPYGFHPDGEGFDKELVEAIKKGDTETILDLDRRYPEAGECGLRSFAFLLGILEARREDIGRGFKADALSYEEPFGVGYLVVNFNL